MSVDKERRPADDEPDRLYAYEDEDYVPYVPLKKRRSDATHNRISGAQTNVLATEPKGEQPQDVKVPSLLETARELRTMDGQNKSQSDLEAEEAARFLEAQSMRKKLIGHAEVATDFAHREPLKRSWRAPKYILEQSPSRKSKIRKHYHVIVEGEDVPPIISSFQVCPSSLTKGHESAKMYG